MTKEELLFYIKNNTDNYFTKTKNIISQSDNPDCYVVYAYFLRNPTIYACNEAKNFIIQVKDTLGYDITIYENFQEGDSVPAGEPLFFLKGKIKEFSELETLLLQKNWLCLCLCLARL